jgi:hypothetical protein
MAACPADLQDEGRCMSRAAHYVILANFFDGFQARVTTGRRLIASPIQPRRSNEVYEAPDCRASADVRCPGRRGQAARAQCVAATKTMNSNAQSSLRRHGGFVERTVPAPCLHRRDDLDPCSFAAQPCAQRRAAACSYSGMTLGRFERIVLMRVLCEGCVDSHCGGWPLPTWLIFSQRLTPARGS